MKKTLLIICWIPIFLVYTKNTQAQHELTNSPNYYEYHKLVNKAEYFYFILNNVDSSFYYYQTAFTNFEFAFARDCIIAAQLSLLKKRQKLLFFL